MGRPAFHQLQRSGTGRLTVTHVPTTGPSSVARGAAYEWAQAVWETYLPARPEVSRWLHESGFEV